MKKILLALIILLIGINVYATGNVTLSKNSISIDKGKTGNIVVKNASGNTVTDSNSVLGTGSKVILGNNEYIIIIDGDINKDGKINALDYIAIRKHMMKEKIMDGGSIEYRAADMNKDDKINALDYVAIRNIMLRES